MAYSRIGIPRIYPDWINWLLTINRISSTDITQSGLSSSSPIDFFDLNPSNVISLGGNGVSTVHNITINTEIGTDSFQTCNFMAILGHNFYDSGAKFQIQTDDDSGFGSPASYTLDPIVNAPFSSSYSSPTANGWSLVHLTPNIDNKYIRIKFAPQSTNYSSDVKIGSIIIGKYYTFPVNADVNFSRNVVFENDVMSARGGKRYSNLKHRGSANWFLNQWNVSSGWSSPDEIRFQGRRIYDINFSFLNDTNMIPDELRGSDMLDKTSFYSDVTNKVMGSHLPFIFQPDSTETDYSSGFTLTRLMDSKESQTGINSWNLSLKLEEEF